MPFSDSGDGSDPCLCLRFCKFVGSLRCFLFIDMQSQFPATMLTRHFICLCFCQFPHFYQNNRHIGLRAHPISIQSPLNCVATLFPKTHMLKHWELGIQHLQFWKTQFNPPHMIFISVVNGDEYLKVEDSGGRGRRLGKLKRSTALVKREKCVSEFRC